MGELLTFSTESLTVRPWPDDLTQRRGFDPRSPYVEEFWLGILGPSATWLLRRMAAAFDESPEGFEMPMTETALSLGLGDRGGRNSPFFRTLNRLVQFDMARSTAPGTMEVRRRLPPLSRRHLARLPFAVQQAHQRWTTGGEAEGTGEVEGDAGGLLRRGRQLALTLLELGESAEEAEEQLLRWSYPPETARAAATWAWDRHSVAEAAAGQMGG